METTFISNGGSGCLLPKQDVKGSFGTDPFQHIVLSSLKALAHLPRIDHYQRCNDPEHGPCVPRTRVATTRGKSWNKAFVAIVVLLFLLIMILLLLWNYKCIVVDKVCQGNDEMLTPVFKID